MAYVARRGDLTGGAYYRLLRAATRLFLLPYVKLFLGVTGESCEFLIGEQGVPPHRVKQLDFGVDTDLFHPDKAARLRMRASLGLPADATVVLQTGKLSREKHPEWLAEACGPIMKTVPRLWLVFVGGGAPEAIEGIKRRLADHRVEERAKFIPAVDVNDLAAFYNFADLCVYPGESSLSCLEAAACSCAVVVTDLPAGREREVRGAVTCYETGNIDDLRGRMKGLLADPDRRRESGLRARAAVLRYYSYDTVASQSEALMEAIVNEPADGSKRGTANRVRH